MPVSRSWHCGDDGNPAWQPLGLAVAVLVCVGCGTSPGTSGSSTGSGSRGTLGGTTSGGGLASSTTGSGGTAGASTSATVSTASTTGGTASTSAGVASTSGSTGSTAASSSSGSSGASSSSGGGADGGNPDAGGPVQCFTYGGSTGGGNLCGTPVANGTNGVTCGAAGGTPGYPYECFDICSSGQYTCFDRPDCCASSCSGSGGTLVCTDDTGTALDGETAYCETAPEDVLCSSNITCDLNGDYGPPEEVCPVQGCCVYAGECIEGEYTCGGETALTLSNGTHCCTSLELAGWTCSADSQCISGHCDVFCRAQTCVGPGDACSAHVDCCSGGCFNGTCRALTDPCELTNGAGAITCGSGCVDPSTDTQNCGGCGNACPAYPQFCDAGTCDCGVGQAPCSGYCTDILSNPSSCGGCGISCPTGGSCIDAGCECPAGELDCGGTCLDVSADPANCGGCGVTCAPDAGGETAECIDGTCRITETLIGDGQADCVTSDGTFLFAAQYPASARNILQTDLNGAGGVSLAPYAYPYTYGAYRMAQDGLNVYLRDTDTNLFVFPRDGSPSTILRGFVSGVVSDGATVYLATVDDSSIYTWPAAALLNGNSTSSPTRLLSDPAVPASVALSNGRLYWLDQHPDGGIHSAWTDGGDQRTEVQDIFGAQGLALAVDSSGIYWASAVSGTATSQVFEATSDGGAILLDSAGGFTPVASDGAYVYYVQSYTTLMKVPKLGGTPVKVADAPANASVHCLWLDATYLYWADGPGAWGGPLPGTGVKRTAK